MTNVNDLLQWEALISMAAQLGVRSWAAIHALLTDAGADDATIAALLPKWDALVSDVRRAAGVPPLS